MIVKKVKDLKLMPEISIGTVGHVDHGKTTLVKALSGVWADTHSEEIKRGITIKLGYANSTFYKCTKCKKHGIKEKCDCGEKAKPLRKISFVDAPGHESLMATMLSGATLMDGAILLISANEECPQPQTSEHLMALEISGIKNLIIVQNKIDTVDKETALKNYQKIKEFIKGTVYEKAPIIPISAQQNVNLDLLIETIEKIIPTPKRDPKIDPFMYIARSFDINKPGSKITNIQGGVIGGALSQGIIEVGQKIEIKPGRSIETKKQKTWKSIITKIIALKYGGFDVKKVSPGGTFGILTSLDPAIVKSDLLAGSVAGLPGKLPDTLEEFILETHLLKRVVGSKEELNVDPIKLSELLMFNVNASATIGNPISIKGKNIKCKLKLPVCASKGSRVTISRRIGNRFRLIGYGIIK
jgi:translation initiation factor 2 subunit 3